MSYSIMPDADYKDACDAIREKDGSAALIKSGEMGAKIRAIPSGGEDFFSYATSMREVFKYASFPGGEVKLNLPHTENMAGSFWGSNAEKITVISSSRTPIYFYNTFDGCLNLKEIDLRKCELRIMDADKMFRDCFNLETISGSLHLNRPNGRLSLMLHQCFALKEIAFDPASIEKSLSLAFSSRLSDASVQSVIDGLAEAGTAQTLTFHPDVKARLTEEQIARITGKNWNLA